MSALPDGLPATLHRLGIDPAQLTAAVLDSDGHWLLLETAQALLASDRNGVSDLYRLELLTGAVALISHTPQGTAGNGASTYPAADARGELIVFQSDASDLVAKDRNGRRDVFLYDLGLERLERVGADLVTGGGAHPAIDAEGNLVLFDQPQTDGQRAIFATRTAELGQSQVLSLSEDSTGTRLDSHHPAISADGRFIAYLEQPVARAEGVACQVHLYDRATEVYHRQGCPAPLAAQVEQARATFSPDGRALQWSLPGRREPIWLNNPLSPIGDD